VSVDIVFIPLDYGVHAFDRSAFFIGHPFHLFGVLNNDRPRNTKIEIKQVFSY
jgi:hypothetical protein